MVARSLIFVGLASCLMVAHGTDTCDEFQCNSAANPDPTNQCVAWNKVNDAINDCPNKRDEQVAKIFHCPPRLDKTGAVGYLTFRSDASRAYATIHKQDSSSGQKCVFPFEHNGEKYHECTKTHVNSLHGDPASADVSERLKYEANKERLWCLAGAPVGGGPNAMEFCTDRCGGTTAFDDKSCNQYMVMPFLAGSRRAPGVGGAH
jgi:hypothetical protein